MVRIVDGFLIPTPDPEAEPFWAALRNNEFRLPKCTGCKETFFPPMPRCPSCGSSSIEYVLASGKGTLYSWVVTHYPFHPSFRADLPFTVAVVDLDEGARMYARLEGPIERAPVADARVKAKVKEYVGFNYPVFVQDDS